MSNVPETSLRKERAGRRAPSPLASALLCALSFIAGTQIHAQSPDGRSPKEMPLMRSAFEGWKDRASLIEASIREGNYKKAESAANSLIRDLTRKITGGPDAGRLLAMPVSLRALARVGLKKERDALWDYQMAGVLWPALSQVRLANYGTTGERMRSILEEASRQSESRRLAAAARSETTELSEKDRRITPPKAVSTPKVEFPESLRAVLKEGQAIIVAQIDEEGHLDSPGIQEGSSRNALFLYAALEGVRSWRFQPAKLGGVPVPVFYSLTVNYKLRG